MKATVGRVVHFYVRDTVPLRESASDGVVPLAAIVTAVTPEYLLIKAFGETADYPCVVPVTAGERVAVSQAVGAVLLLAFKGKTFVRGWWEWPPRE